MRKDVRLCFRLKILYQELIIKYDYVLLMRNNIADLIMAIVNSIEMVNGTRKYISANICTFARAPEVNVLLFRID